MKHSLRQYWTESISPAGIITREGPRLNQTPMEGLNLIQRLLFKSGTLVPTWYIGIFEGDYTPNPDLSVTAATLPGLATECTAYTPSTRVEFNEGTVANGEVDNAAGLAEFTFTSQKTIYGCFMSSASAKGSTSGTLISVVRFASPKVQEIGSVLRIFAGPTAESLAE